MHYLFRRRKTDETIEQLSWRRSLKVFGPGEGASLRNHREIVAAAWTDFEARLPDRYPPTLSALLTFEDGREPGSKYPNLLRFDSGRSYHTQRRVVSWMYHGEYSKAGLTRFEQLTFMLPPVFYFCGSAGTGPGSVMCGLV